MRGFYISISTKSTRSGETGKLMSPTSIEPALPSVSRPTEGIVAKPFQQTRRAEERRVLSYFMPICFVLGCPEENEICRYS
jgi:hypothetical protein